MSECLSKEPVLINCTADWCQKKIPFIYKIRKLLLIQKKCFQASCVIMGLMSVCSHLSVFVVVVVSPMS